MSTGALVVIIVVVVIVVVAVIVAMMTARRRRLRQRFGPEYDRAVGERRSQLKAESELASRERRVRELDIRPLSESARANYAAQWRTIQEQFVDQPEDAVVKAQRLVTTVMDERGYPTEGHDQMLADLSVEHAGTLEHYRSAYTISQSAAEGNASTEDLRQAMIQYRTLFSDLLGEPDGRPAAAPDASGARPAAGTSAAPQDTTTPAPAAGRADAGRVAAGPAPVTDPAPGADAGPVSDPTPVTAPTPVTDSAPVTDPGQAADPAAADPAAAEDPAGELRGEPAPRTRRR